jgi:hypothetical protein
MHDPPAYVWAIIIAGPTAIAATTCIALYGGTKRAGQGQRRAALLAGATAGLLGGRFTASAVIAGHRWYPHAAVVSGPGGRVPGHAASAQPDAGGGARCGARFRVYAAAPHASGRRRPAPRGAQVGDRAAAA